VGNVAIDQDDVVVLATEAWTRAGRKLQPRRGAADHDDLRLRRMRCRRERHVPTIVARTMDRNRTSPPMTPDGRYLVVRGRLWRRANPALADDVRQALVDRLMDARRAAGRALKTGDAAALVTARDAVDAAKVALGERGPVWWDDGAPDLNRHMARNTHYTAWFAGLEAAGAHAA
jgi:hypothetical protein